MRVHVCEDQVTTGVRQHTPGQPLVDHDIIFYKNKLLFIYRLQLPKDQDQNECFIVADLGYIYSLSSNQPDRTIICAFYYLSLFYCKCIQINANNIFYFYAVKLYFV